MEVTLNSITEKLVDGLKEAANELEKFRLQASLGKAEALDAYEEAKKRYAEYLQKAKAYLDNAKDIAGEKANQLKAIYEELELQLALGKADTKDLLDEQKKKINLVLNKLDTYFKSNETFSKYYAEVQNETEKFKIKLQILRLERELDKLEVKGSLKEKLEEKKNEFVNKLSEFKDKLLKKEEEKKENWVDSVKDEVSEAYQKLKNVFVD